MKHAELWKRILHMGLWEDKSDPDLTYEHDIIRATTIVAGPQPRIDGVAYDVQAIVDSRVAMPLDEFWIEFGPFDDDGSYVGALVHSFVDTGPNVRAWMVITVGADFRSGRPYQHGMVVIAADGDGTIREVREMKSHGAELNREMFGYVMDAVSLMSCSNVSIEPRDNRERDMRIAAKRYGGNPDYYRYHVLTVRPAGSKPGTPGQEIGNMPRHVCRGHFAEYGPEYGKGLLFGKLAGRFYIPPHMKGDKKNGTVAKDYEVRA